MMGPACSLCVAVWILATKHLLTIALCHLQVSNPIADEENDEGDEEDEEEGEADMKAHAVGTGATDDVNENV